MLHIFLIFVTHEPPPPEYTILHVVLWYIEQKHALSYFQ